MFGGAARTARLTPAEEAAEEKELGCPNSVAGFQRGYHRAKGNLRMKKDQLKKLLCHRVCLSPPALRSNAAGTLAPFNDDWSIQEITGDHIKLRNPITHHEPLLGLDQIRSYTSDPHRNTDGFKHGFLSLHVQLTIQDREVLIDLLARRPRADRRNARSMCNLTLAKKFHADSGRSKGRKSEAQFNELRKAVERIIVHLEDMEQANEPK